MAQNYLKMWKVCAWCQTVLEEGEEGGMVSHGICEACSERLDSGYGAVIDQAEDEIRDQKLAERVKAKVKTRWGGNDGEEGEGGLGQAAEEGAGDQGAQEVPAQDQGSDRGSSEAA